MFLQTLYCVWCAINTGYCTWVLQYHTTQYRVQYPGIGTRVMVCVSLVDIHGTRHTSFHGHIALFESIENNYSPLQLETSITLYWMTHLTTIMLAILTDILGCDITLSLLKMSSLQSWPIRYRINLTSNSPLDFQKLSHLGIKFVSEWGSEHHLWHIHTKPDVFLGMST